MSLAWLVDTNTLIYPQITQNIYPQITQITPNVLDTNKENICVICGWISDQFSWRSFQRWRTMPAKNQIQSSSSKRAIASPRAIARQIEKNFFRHVRYK